MVDPSKWVSEKRYDGTTYDAERHKRERVEQGFSTYDWWNFNSYIAWVNIAALEKFKDGAGFPADLKGMDEWRAELDVMIDGFKALVRIMDDYDPRTTEHDKAVYDKGMALYAKRLFSLWD